MIIDFLLGSSQSFRPRFEDITVQGRLYAAQFPLRRAQWAVNGQIGGDFYVESVPDLVLRAGRYGQWWASPVDWRTGYKDSPAGLRLKQLGDFTLEIPIASPYLREGPNVLEVEIEDHGKAVGQASVDLYWDPAPIELPLDLSNLANVKRLQDIGQPVNGGFTVDAQANCIRAWTPAYPDSLLVLGSPHRSQEATYRVLFHQPAEAKYVGLSDFFVRNEPEVPPIGIKPGYSTAGLATVDRDGNARAWLAHGDNAHRQDGWLVFTQPPARFVVQAERPYRVRHRCRLRDGLIEVMFRIWPEGESEPTDWLCAESDSSIPQDKPRFKAASFALFMHSGVGTEWSDVRVDEYHHKT